MEPNTRDTPLRRFSTYVWGTALMLGVCIVAIVLYPLFQPDRKEYEDAYQEHAELNAKLKEIHKKQATELKSYNYDPELAAENLLNKVKK